MNAFKEVGVIAWNTKLHISVRLYFLQLTSQEQANFRTFHDQNSKVRQELGRARLKTKLKKLKVKVSGLLYKVRSTRR